MTNAAYLQPYKIDSFSEVINHLVLKGGPDFSDYKDLNTAVVHLHKSMFKTGESLSVRVKSLHGAAHAMSIYSYIFASTATVTGFAYLKPHGYAGDFEVIERIYNLSSSMDNQLYKWDQYFHALDGSAAVRDREHFLYDQVIHFSPQSILSLGSGPGLDLRKTAKNLTGKEFTLLDTDNNALSRSKINLAKSDNELRYINQNMLYIKSKQTYDMIWSAGLFDYFSSKVFSRMIARLYEMLSDKGVLILGHFSPDNKSRSYIETVCDWVIHHRSPQLLKSIAKEAGVAFDKVRVVSGDNGVNLFLIIEK